MKTNARRFGFFGALLGVVAPLGLLVVGPILGDIAKPEAILAGMAVGGALFLSVAGTLIGKREDALVARNAELRILSRLLEQQSITDELTQIANRRSFDIELDKEFARARRYQTPLTLIMADIDHFKLFNDSHGHQVGDVVLKNVGQLLSEDKRLGDVVARYGGEEFAAILPHTTASEGVIWAERICTKLASQPILTKAGHLHVTASFGVAELTVVSVDPGALVAAADSALYRAKASGRNRVEV